MSSWHLQKAIGCASVPLAKYGDSALSQLHIAYASKYTVPVPVLFLEYVKASS